MVQVILLIIMYVFIIVDFKKFVLSQFLVQVILIIIV